MGRLQMTILAFGAISCCIHIRRQLQNRDYIKHLFLGNDAGKSRILYLDYIRLMAALFVIFVHCLDFSTARIPEGTTAWVGVQSLSSILLICNTLFIMNSGALILRGQRDGLGGFYYKRFLQVALPFFLLLQPLYPAFLPVFQFRLHKRDLKSLQRHSGRPH